MFALKKKNTVFHLWHCETHTFSFLSSCLFALKAEEKNSSPTSAFYTNSGVRFSPCVRFSPTKFQKWRKSDTRGPHTLFPTSLSSGQTRPQGLKLLPKSKLCVDPNLFHVFHISFMRGYCELLTLDPQQMQEEFI